MFSIDNIAAIEIIRLLRGSAGNNLLRFFECASADQHFIEVRKAVAEGSQITEDVLELGKTRFANSSLPAQTSLLIDIQKREDCPPEYIQQVGAFAFALAEEDAELLTGFRLFFENGSFLFRDSDGACYTLLSLKMKRLGLASRNIFGQ